MVVNSPEYWNDRLRGDWDAKSGREQTLWLARLALRHLPRSIADDIRQHRLGICDYGCALGDAMAELTCAFPGSPLTGIDCAESGIARAREAFPSYAFLRASSMSELGRTFDVVYCSNTLEHFADPMGPLLDLARAASRYLLVLVPFRERERLSEHFVSFDYASFPARVGGLHLVAARDFDVSHETPSYWPGAQILVVYAHPDAVGAAGLRLSDLGLGDLDERLSQAEATSAAIAAERDGLAVSRAELAQRLEGSTRETAALSDALAAARAAEASLRADLECARGEEEAASSDLERARAEEALMRAFAEAQRRELERVGEQLRAALKELEARADELRHASDEKRTAAERLHASDAALSDLYGSNFYKVASTYYRWRDHTAVGTLARRVIRTVRRVHGSPAAIAAAPASGTPAPAAEAPTPASPIPLEKPI